MGSDPIATIVAIWRYPTKSLASEELASTEIQVDGLPGDRNAALVVTDGHPRVGKPYRGKENRFLHLTSDTERAQTLARSAGASVSLETGEGRYFDAAPVSLILDTWISDVERLAGRSVDVRAFRPNFFATAQPAFDATEQALVGQTLRIGSATVRVRKPIERCVAITYDQETGDSDPDLLSTVAFRRGNIVGVYCDVLQPGTVTRGDSILMERPDANPAAADEPILPPF